MTWLTTETISQLSPIYSKWIIFHSNSLSVKLSKFSVTPVNSNYDYYTTESLIWYKFTKYGSRKGTIQKYFENPKKYLESISFRQIAFEKFLKSRNQFQILAYFIDPQESFMKIENSLQSKNLSKIRKFLQIEKNIL